MPIKRDSQTGKFVSASADAASPSIAEILAESDQRKAALDADAAKTPEQIEAEKKAADEAAQKERDEQARPKDTEASDFLGDFVSDSSRTPKPDKKAEAEKRKAEADRRAAEKKKKDDEAAAAARRAQPRQDTLTSADIAAAAAEGVARVLKPEQKAKEADKTNPDDALAPEEKRKLAVLGHMETLFPDRYKGLADKYRTGQKELETYAAKWEKENPGREFDETDDDHKEFMADHNVDWLEEDYIEAVADMRAEQKHADAQKQSSDKVTALEMKVNRREKLTEAAPAIATEQTFARKKLWADFKQDALNEAGFPDRDKITALNAKDPISTAYRIAAAKDLDAEVETIYMLMPPDEHRVAGRGLVDYDPKNPVHVEMGRFCDETEKLLSAKPIEEKTDADGRVFLPAEDYYKLPKEKRANHWTLTAHDVAFLRARKIAKETQAFIAREEQKLKNFAKARGYTPPADAENEDSTVDETHADDGTEKPHSPSLGGESRLAAAKNKAGAGAPGGGKNFFSDF